MTTEIPEPTPTTPPLFLIKGTATAEEVAALTVVLQGIAAASVPVEEPVRSEWAAPRRRVRTTYPAGPGGWRSSALPR